MFTLLGSVVINDFVENDVLKIKLLRIYQKVQFVELSSIDGFTTYKVNTVIILWPPLSNSLNSASFSNKMSNMSSVFSTSSF